MHKHSLVVFVALALAACQGPQPQQLPPPTVGEDPTLRPPRPTLPPLDGSTPRPLAAVRDAKGNQAEFVENELVVATDDPAALDAFLARWQGTVLKAFDPAAAGLSGVGKQYLVRVRADAADTAKLSANLRALDKDSRGALAVSSAAAHKLLAAAAQEQVGGLSVGVNWVSQGGLFTDRATAEAPAGDSIGGTAYTVNAFNWPHLRAGSAQDIGVTEAWRALEMAGKLSNKVKIGVLDMGFQPDEDFPAGWLAISNVPLVHPVGTENLLSCSGGNPCPWHGTAVAQAAAGVPDNGYGAAGPAGPVADLVLVYTSYDYFTVIGALAEARIAGAKVINMSFSAPVPAALAWTALPLEAATRAVRASGALLFASAGNEGKNVEAEDCFVVCWEETWHVPCESGGVICVGGLAWDSKNRASGSNYSSSDGGDDDGDVEIFAPYTLWVGPDPDNPANRARRINGTSFSSPFAAGVAALVWAAKPSLSASEVEDVLMSTAHASPDPKVGKYVNALAAVQKVLGNIPPSVQIVSPGSGTVQIGLGSRLEAAVSDFEDPFPCCTVTWTSSVEGNLGSGYSVDYLPTSLGSRTITVTATDSAGATASVSRAVTVVNTPPTVAINAPFSGQQFFRGVSYTLRGVSYDPNEAGFQLPCSSLSWASSAGGDGLPKTGCNVTVSFGSNGPRTLTLTGTDSHGGSSSASVNVVVIDPPANLPPVVNITSPQDGVSVGPDTTLKLAGNATDPEGGAVTLAWDVTTGYDPSTGTGAQTFAVTPAANGDWKPSDSIPYGGCEVSDTLRLRLKAKDPQNNEGFDFVVIKVSRIC
ncbi:Subtilisin DY [Calidithermus terrae]|uniref:Subtilisin DY n=1 Tax=Calidithermus terrae TaxID=1408545 RepID=A0A399EQQ1_9DEIN|nr:S8 family serine peptidase [Calidithermus terrae]RIH86974.1 Subtilisin DY [Calidithermus terrae]